MNEAGAGRTVLRDVTYREYVRFRNSPRNDHLRMTYHDGVLELMSPEYRHEAGSSRIDGVVRAVASVFEVPSLLSGSTTFRKGELKIRRGEGARRGNGKEPDESYYFAHLAAIRG